MRSRSIETRSFPNSLAASLAVLPSMSLIPFAPFAAVTDAQQRPGFPIANDLEKSK
jgi:hypothetical protein